jgi:hypothetical protein
MDCKRAGRHTAGVMLVVYAAVEQEVSNELK